MLEPSINTNGVVSSRKEYTYDELKERLSFFYDAGFRNLDYGGVGFGSFLKIENIELHARLLREMNIKATQTHTPIIGDITRTDDGKVELLWTEKDEKTAEIAFLATNKLGCKYTVIHPIGLSKPIYTNPIVYSPQPPYKNDALGSREANIKMFRHLIPLAEKYDVTICIETLGPDYYCNSPVELKELVDTLNSERIKCCVDVGHVNLMGHNPADAVRLLGDSIAVLHLQDNFGHNDGHCLPPFGNIDWKDLCKALKEVNYKGTLNFEINGGKEYELSDFANHAYLNYAYQMGLYLKSMIEE